ncbi:partner of xrn-2 protein 1 [Aethina tumida]|uniref:partner of xrn-2 protein 1 n=1 Tax=Aethina tumida TaxID=116153 RepID=UPI00096AFCAF|nr:partner of xrn-2 protein 1 [Aethina tumida]
MAKKYPTDWDIDQYRDDTEPEDHWALKREFMKVHKGKFEEEYLVALAKTFANIEFLGCIYPAKLMIRIAELSKEVAKDYREVKKTKLQRTFVTASDAAESKAKRLKTN